MQGKGRQSLECLKCSHDLAVICGTVPLCLHWINESQLTENHGHPNRGTQGCLH